MKTWALSISVPGSAFGGPGGPEGDEETPPALGSYSSRPSSDPPGREYEATLPRVPSRQAGTTPVATFRRPIRGEDFPADSVTDPQTGRSPGAHRTTSRYTAGMASSPEPDGSSTGSSKDGSSEDGSSEDGSSEDGTSEDGSSATGSLLSPGSSADASSPVGCASPSTDSSGSPDISSESSGAVSSPSAGSAPTGPSEGAAEVSTGARAGGDSSRG